MNLKLLSVAALGATLALPAGPLAAQHIRPHAVGQGVPNAKTSHYVGAPGGEVNPCTRNGRMRGCFGSGYGDGYAYESGDWALANNRAFDSNSYNDWWNDRPDRAFPRWVQDQRARGTCDPDRMWWSGSGWHC